jgi:hypothetical protein
MCCIKKLAVQSTCKDLPCTLSLADAKHIFGTKSQFSYGCVYARTFDQILKLLRPSFTYDRNWAILESRLAWNCVDELIIIEATHLEKIME